MSTQTVKVIAPIPPEVQALTNTCEELAKQNALERFELAVKSRVERAIADDNEYRQTDEMLHQIVVYGDAVDAATKATISELHARHKQAIAAVAPWKQRWAAMADSLKGVMARYRRAKEELAQRQQRELERVAQAERDRKAAEARQALRNGDVAAAQAIVQQAQAIVAPVIMEATPVLENSTVRKVWEITGINAQALINAIASGSAPMALIKEWDTTLLKKEAAKRGGLPPEWGVTARQTEAMSVRR